jgi:hypothetical protein
MSQNNLFQAIRAHFAKIKPSLFPSSCPQTRINFAQIPKSTLIFFSAMPFLRQADDFATISHWSASEIWLQTAAMSFIFWMIVASFFAATDMNSMKFFSLSLRPSIMPIPSMMQAVRHLPSFVVIGFFRISMVRSVSVAPVFALQSAAMPC